MGRSEWPSLCPVTAGFMGKWNPTKVPFNVVGEVLGVIQKQHQSSLRVIQGQEADGDFVWATEL